MVILIGLIHINYSYTPFGYEKFSDVLFCCVIILVHKERLNLARYWFPVQFIVGAFLPNSLIIITKKSRWIQS